MPNVWREPTRVYDPLARVEELADPGAAGELIATQLVNPELNGNVASGAMVPRVEQLTDLLADIIIDTVDQGASTVEVHLIDPQWALLTRYGNRPAFFDVDDAGLLIPVDINFPKGTDRWWRLCQASPVVDPTQPNVFIFEDRIVSLLRDQGGPKHASANQTRAAFIFSCVQSVPSIRFVCPALEKPAGAVGGDVSEKTVDGYNTTGIISQSASPIAGSAKIKGAAPARRNPSKQPGTTRQTRRDGAVWTPGGWRYTKPVDGMSTRTLDVLNPPTNQKDG